MYKFVSFTSGKADILSLFFLSQSVAVFTPLIVILVFTFLKRSERGDLKEALLGSFFVFHKLNLSN